MNDFSFAGIFGRFWGGIRTKIMFSLFCFAFIILMTQFAFSQNESIMDWVYPGAFDTQKKSLEKEQMQFIYCKVKAGYPSVKVYDFYANILKAQNYQEMHWKQQDLGVWFSFIDSNAKDNPLVHELRAIWADKKRKVMFILSLRYYSKSDLKQDEPDNKIQHVHFQKRPFLRLNGDVRLRRNGGSP